MSKYKKDKSLMLFFAILLSVLFVAGIPGIVLSAGKSAILLALSIICVAAGFYVMPILWIQFGSLCSLGRLIFAVENEYIYTVKDLAIYLNKDEKSVRNEINTCIRKRYLTGYLFDGETLTLNENKKVGKTVRTVVCSGCGATVNITDGMNRCEY